MKLLKTFLPLVIAFLSLPSMASTTSYVATLYDDAGAPAPGATFTQTAVKTLAAGSTVTVTLTPVDLGNGDYSVAYDPAANGEAVAKFTPTLTGHTFTNGNALVKFVMTADSSQVAKISTNTGDSPNTVTEQSNAASSATGIATANTGIAALPAANATAVWGTATKTGGTITTYTGNTPQTGDSFAALAALPSTAFITIPGTSTISGTLVVLTQKQVTALNDAVSGGDNVTSGPPVASASVTVTYYLRGSAHTSGNIVEIATVNYDANKAQTSRTVKVASPFPTF
jgi:hypothetical protein